ncbi:hypothetical protein HYH02_002379 [Chlamydomonas schloesseri]|uniref:SAC domain-containing protein n=1 Tax=Chlamydomonas schloesseri TaxID=2026947 RepID=A0A835WRX8_9CHLO|nr:hypothetical protein HYH02_002379 [Chlamydomonas schloesseri]|eukprot:KAG2453044.1 hypothetical protein HYH02_002379 [Chlamydomonas schloesseri]
MARFPYTTLRIFQQGAQAVVQPAPDGNVSAVETLVVDLANGKSTVTPSQSVMRGTPTVECLGLLGVCKLTTGAAALVVITEARQVAALGPNSSAVYELVRAQVLTEPGAEKNSANRQLLSLLRDAVDPARSGRGIYFSHFYDLTQSAQRIADRDADPAAAAAPLASPQRADSRFWYNRALSASLLDAGAHRFTPPAMLGFLRQLPGLTFAGGKSATLTLIARRGVDRAGTRQWRRGCDSKGNVANFVETEELLSTPAGDLASYVQVRGSIPLLWTQLPNIKYKPTTVIAAPGQSVAVFDAHMGSLKAAYGDVVAINLINHKGTEGKLQVAFQTEAERYTRTPGAGLHYIAFDFHHECSKGRYDRIELLMQKIAPDVNRQAFFLRRAGGEVVKRQAGTVRTNCIDCLDRTNVMQGVLGRKALEAMLAALGLMPAGGPGPAHSLPAAFPAVEKEFKILWADHGDGVSTQYAGTGAMKSGFTRTGKRTFGGVIDDGVKAVTRYYLNNFQDGRKQDAVDLVSGAYQVVPGSKLPLRPQPSPLIPIVLALVLVAFGAHQAGQFLAGGLAQVSVGVADAAAGGVEAAATSQSQQLVVVLTRAVLPLLLGLGLLAFVVQNGKHLVNKPLLCPHLAVTVQAAKKSGKGGKQQ